MIYRLPLSLFAASLRLYVKAATLIRYCVTALFEYSVTFVP